MKINCQAFLENKKILSITKIDTEIDNYNYDSEKNEINGNIKVTTNCYVDNMDENKDLIDNVPFNVLLMEQNKNNFNLSIGNLVYNLIEGRGVELEFDIELEEKDVIDIPIIVEEENLNNHSINERKIDDSTHYEEQNDIEIIKDQVIEEIETKLEEKLSQVDDNFPESNNFFVNSLDRSYTHLKITFDKNEKIKIQNK